MKKEVMLFVGGIVLALFLMQVVSAGVGIKWGQESFLVNEKSRTCITYSVYNPWPEDSSVQIELPENLRDILTSQEAEVKLVPANTASTDAIPIEFCFKTPKVYEEECLVGGLLCKQECKEEQVTYEGEVSVKSVPGTTDITGSGGSATQMSVSAPLRLKIVCNAHSTEFTLVYIALGIIALIGIAVVAYRKYRKPEQERKKEKLESLKKEMKTLIGKK